MWVKRVFTQTFGVVGAIIENNGKILLVREAQRKGPDNGKWNHPAGWIDVGEDPLVAVKREVKEETGYGFKPTNVLGVYSLVRQDLKKQLNATPHPIKIIFIGNISGKQSKLHSDVSEIRWFMPEEIQDMDKATLRDLDIKKMLDDYFSGKRYPLEVVSHTVSK